MRFRPFEMERWQSTYEHRVRFNLSESGVHPLSLGELLSLAELDGLDDVRLGYGQSNGSDELRAAIAALHPGATGDSVLVPVGGAEANFAAWWQLMDPDAPAAVMLPNYMQIPGLVTSFGGRLLPFHLREDEGWQPDLNELADALDRGARLILVTNPNNPTGIALSPESMDAIVQLARRHEAWILSDEVYRGAEVQGPETASFWGRYDRVLVTNSLSKAYGLPGLRLGWVLGPAETIGDLWSRTDYTTITVASLSDALARAALEPRTRSLILERTRSIIRGNLDILTGWMDDVGLFDYRRPDAGAICYARYDAPIGSTALAEKLRTEKDLLIVPGDHFGMDRYLRIGFGPPAGELRTALDRLGQAFAEVLAEAGTG